MSIRQKLKNANTEYRKYRDKDFLKQNHGSLLKEKLKAEEDLNLLKSDSLLYPDDPGLKKEIANATNRFQDISKRVVERESYEKRIKELPDKIRKYENLILEYEKIVPKRK